MLCMFCGVYVPILLFATFFSWKKSVFSSIFLLFALLRIQSRILYRNIVIPKFIQLATLAVGAIVIAIVEKEQIGDKFVNVPPSLEIIHSPDFKNCTRVQNGTFASMCSANYFATTRYSQISFQTMEDSLLSIYDTLRIVTASYAEQYGYCISLLQNMTCAFMFPTCDFECSTTKFCRNDCKKMSSPCKEMFEEMVVTRKSTVESLI